MHSLDDIVLGLFERQIINVVGLPSSGRTTTVNRLGEHARELGMEIHSISARDFAGASWKDVRRDLRGRCTSDVNRLFIVDNCDWMYANYGCSLMDRILGSIVFTDEVDKYRASRLLMVTVPRDRDAIGESENVRERCKPLAPCNIIGYQQGSSQLPTQAALTGCLRDEQHLIVKRLLDNGPRPWNQCKHDFLTPLIYLDNDCAFVEKSLASSLPDVLMGYQWPGGNAQASARRLRARCGLAEVVMWVDPYLSDGKNVASIGQFLDIFFAGPEQAPKELRILSSKRVGSVLIQAADFRTTLIAQLGARVWFSRLHWRLFPPRDAHDRHLALLGRREVFAVPPVDRLLGLVPISNETDSRIDPAVLAAEELLWARGEQVL